MQTDRSVPMLGLSILSVLAFAVACSSTPETSAAPAPALRQTAPDRKIIRTGYLTVTVAAPATSLPDVQRIVQDAGGFLESTHTAESRVSASCRVPAEKLDAIMDAVAALGSEESRSISASDVTEQHADLSTRLKNSLALRDRLRQLLDRAKDVKDVLAIETELTRIQSEIETMQASRDRLDSQIALSALSITLERRRILGPLGYLSYGLWWGISKLFVIR